MMKLTVNGQTHDLDVEGDTPLLWVIRDDVGLTGTKFGCGVGACGACTVLLEGEPTRSCVLPMSAVAGRSVTTIEGLSADKAHPVQKAWIAESVPQCGYCQSGMILTAAALLKRKAHPTDTEIDSAMTNICRCGTYDRVRKAIHRAARG
jgi:isoquinoline 1-oxidoreductase subunit alpha